MTWIEKKEITDTIERVEGLLVDVYPPIKLDVASITADNGHKTIVVGMVDGELVILRTEP